jgi:hypothetical protein
MPDTRHGNVPVTDHRPRKNPVHPPRAAQLGGRVCRPRWTPMHRSRERESAIAGQASDLSLLNSGKQPPCWCEHRAGKQAPPPRPARSPEAAAGVAGASGARAAARAAAPAPGCLLGRHPHAVAVLMAEDRGHLSTLKRTTAWTTQAGAGTRLVIWSWMRRNPQTPLCDCAQAALLLTACPAPAGPAARRARTHQPRRAQTR